MRFYISVSFAAVVMMLLIISAQAHHSQTPFFHMDKTVEVSGVVKSLKLVSPHSVLMLEVTEADGKKVAYVVYGSAGSALKRQEGWTDEWLKPGETIKVFGYPGRNPANPAISGGRITKADGAQRYFSGYLRPDCARGALKDPIAAAREPLCRE